MFVNVSGVFRKGIPWVNVGGTWRAGKASWVRVQGVWRKMTLLVERIFTNLSNSMGFRATNTTINGFIGDPTGTQVLAYGSKNEMRYSSTGGQGSWDTVNLQDSDSSSATISGATYDHNANEFWIGCDNGFIYSSSNPSSGWTRQGRSSSSPIVGMAYVDTPLQKMLALNWDGILNDLYSASEFYPRGLNSGASSGATCLVSGGSLVFAGFKDGYCSLSADGGDTFSRLPRGLGVYSYPTITDAAIYGDIIVVGMANQYASISVDRGQTWKPLPRGLGAPVGTYVASLSITAREEELIAIFSNGKAFQSSDGSFWEPLPRSLNSGFLSPSSAVVDFVGDDVYAGFNLGYSSKGEIDE